MKTVLEQIRDNEQKIRNLSERIRELELESQQLKSDSILGCQHKWDNSIEKYEHEGRNCKLCGTNEIVYLNRWLKSKGAL